MSHPTISITQHGVSPTKMHISPPRLNLRRAASYNTADRGPLSSSSSRFNFDHLAFSSPPPSPGLPLPQQLSRQSYRRGRKLSNTRLTRPSRVIRAILWLSGVALLFYLVRKSIRAAAHGGPESLLGRWVSGSWHGGDGEQEYEMIGQDDLPEFPTPIIVTDRRGRAKWTISIPPSYDFPLSQREYVDMCAKCREVSQRVASMHSRGSAVTTAIVDQISLMSSSAKGKFAPDGGLSIPETDKYFLDIGAAQSLGFLPAGAPSRGGKAPGRVDAASLVSKPLCTSSLTFMLESDDAGLGNTLLSLWMAYGLALRENRAFFLDDARWAYGAFTDMFEAPPQPACRPPPRHEMLPCPRQAQHLVVSAANARMILGGGDETDADAIVFSPAASAKGLDAQHGQRELFTLARAGYEALFRLTATDREYLASRIAEQRRAGDVVVGVHVRHGDCHPLEFQYHESYIPLTQYVDAASELLNASLPSSHHADLDTATSANTKSLLVVASDDPLVYDSAEFAAHPFTTTIRAQELIRLAGKEEIGGAAQPPQPKNVMHRFTAESFGWEGGFFAPMFWHLGEVLPRSPSTANAATHQQQLRPPPKTNVPPTEETLILRGFVGRSYMMDLASLVAMTDNGGGSGGGGVVCAVSSTGCRILAVMMGEERAFRRGEWRNVDGGFGWNGFTW